jgi:hypothetical protein
MENYFFKNMPDFSNVNYFPKNDAFFNTAVSATKELVDINAKYASEVLQKSIGMANLYVENSEKQYQAASEVKDIKDFSATQSALVEDYTARITEVAEANMKIAQGATEEYQAWFKKNFEAAEVVAKEAAEQVQKATTKPAAKKSAKKAA